ncbi:MAG: hypothetical protein ACP5QI_08060 [Candidatus Bathyarchaeia archaeon]
MEDLQIRRFLIGLMTDMLEMAREGMQWREKFIASLEGELRTPVSLGR